jgi:hypothetical protein
VKPPQKQIILGLHPTKYELGWIHPVINERRGAVAACMIGAQKYGVRTWNSPGSEIAMEGEDVRTLGCWGERSMRVQNVQGRRQKRRKIEPRPTGRLTVELDERGAGYLRAFGRQQGDSMAQVHEASSQPKDDPLRSSVAAYRDNPVEVVGDVHAGAMYWLSGPAAKQAIG